MTLGEGIKKLQEQNPEYIILVKNGIFYVAIGQDALFLEQKFGKRKTCFGNNICKCGIPIGSIQEFIKELDDKDIKYIVYRYIPGKDLSLEEQFIEEYREDIGKLIDRRNLKGDCENCKDKRKVRNTNLYIPKDESNFEVKLTNEKEKIVARFVKKYIDEILDKYISEE